MTDGALQFGAVEGLALAVLLDDGEVAQLHALEGGEARPAALALAPPANRRPILGRAAVLHLAVFMRAERTAQASGLVDRKAGTELAHAGVDRLLDRAVIV